MKYGDLFRRVRDWKGLVLTILIILCTLLLTLNRLGAYLAPENWGYSLFSRFQVVFFDSESLTREGIESLRNLYSVKEKYEIALKKIEFLEIKENSIEQLEQENEQLKSQLEFSSNKLKVTNVPAEIIAKDPENILNTITINKGRKHGLEKNQAVIALQDGTMGLVGKIQSIGRTTSIVMPVYDSTCFVATRFQKSRYEGLTQGQGDEENTLLLQHVNKRAIQEIAVDDLVVTSGMNSIYPKGLAVGRVKTIKSREYNTSLDIRLEPSINFSKLEFVVVLTNGGE